MGYLSIYTHHCGLTNKCIGPMFQSVASHFQCGSMDIALRHRHYSIWDDSLGKKQDWEGNTK